MIISDYVIHYLPYALVIALIVSLGGLLFVSAIPSSIGTVCHDTIINGPMTEGTFPNRTAWRAFGNHVFRVYTVGFLAITFPSYNSRGTYPNGTVWTQVVNCK